MPRAVVSHRGRLSCALSAVRGARWAGDGVPHGTPRTAQVTALRAETDYIGAVYDYHKAVAALQAAVGRPLR